MNQSNLSDLWAGGGRWAGHRRVLALMRGPTPGTSRLERDEEYSFINSIFLKREIPSVILNQKERMRGRERDTESAKGQGQTNNCANRAIRPRGASESHD